jgi:hypothetical protein
VILQRLYVALNADYDPIKEVDDGDRNSVVDDWEFNLTGGWRFLHPSEAHPRSSSRYPKSAHALRAPSMAALMIPPA